MFFSEALFWEKACRETEKWDERERHHLHEKMFSLCEFFVLRRILNRPSFQRYPLNILSYSIIIRPKKWSFSISYITCHLAGKYVVNTRLRKFVCKSESISFSNIEIKWRVRRRLQDQDKNWSCLYLCICVCKCLRNNTSESVSVTWNSRHEAMKCKHQTHNADNTITETKEYMMSRKSKQQIMSKL